MTPRNARRARRLVRLRRELLLAVRREQRREQSQELHGGTSTTRRLSADA
jgi:hypothetical protein